MFFFIIKFNYFQHFKLLKNVNENINKNKIEEEVEKDEEEDDDIKNHNKILSEFFQN